VFRAEADESIPAQRRIEAADEVSFEEFVANWFAD
jgi:hypothetical protein